MLLSCSVHRCHDEEGGGTSPALPKVDEEDAAGVAAMATAARLRRGEKIARKKKAESSGEGRKKRLSDGPSAGNGLFAVCCN